MRIGDDDAGAGRQTATRDGSFRTFKDLHRALKNWYGVVYACDTFYLNLIHACGFSYKRPEKVSKSQRLVQRMEFEAHGEKLMDCGSCATPDRGYGSG